MVSHPTLALDDPAFYAVDPYAGFAWLRANDPVHRFEGDDGAFWAITRQPDVLYVSKHPELFASGKGVLLADLTRPVLTTDSIIYLTHPSTRSIASSSRRASPFAESATSSPASASSQPSCSTRSTLRSQSTWSMQSRTRYHCS